MENSKHKTTLLVISAGLLAFYFLTKQQHVWMIYTALGISAAGLISAYIAELIHKIWFWIAEKMGYVMSRLILGITFIFILVPLGFLSGLFRKDMMMLKRQGKTYYREREHLFVPKDFKDPW